MQLYEHQKLALEQSKDSSRVAYYLDMGLGKTYVGSEKAISMNANIILTVCQKSKIQDWFNHFNEHYECRLYDLTNKKDFFNFLNDKIHPDVPSI